MVRINPHKMRHQKNHPLFMIVAGIIPLKNDKPKSIISSEVSHLSWNVVYAKVQHVHLYWDAKLVHGVVYIQILKVSGSDIRQKSFVPLIFYLVLPLFWRTSGISFTGKARRKLQKDGGRKCPCLTCTVIWTQDTSEQLWFWSTLKYLLR